MHRRLLLLLPCLLLTLTACGMDSGDPEKVTYAPSLGVDLTRMEERPSGLYVLDQEVGTGVEAVAGRYVEVHYSGWLVDGTLFDTSRDSNTPLPFTLGTGSVIAGFEEGVTGMRVNGKRRLILPSKLGYGPRIIPGIPADSVLIFDVELLLAR